MVEVVDKKAAELAKQIAPAMPKLWLMLRCSKRKPMKGPPRANMPK